MDHEELRYWLRLQLAEGVGNTTARHLLTAFGLPTSLFSQTESALREVVTERQAKALSRIPEGLALALETTWEWLQADPQRRRIMTLSDAAYPQALLNTEDPPVQGTQGPTPALTAQWTDQQGVVHTVNTPIVSTTPQGIQTAVALHNRLVGIMQAQYPPRHP